MAILEWARSLRAATLTAVAACSVEPQNSLLGASTATRDASTSATPTGAFIVDIASYKTSGAFVKMTTAPYASLAASKARIDIWVSAADAATYATVDPSKTGSKATLPCGATIIREIIDETNTITKLTVMVKGAAGYNPDVGDYYWMVTDPSGVVLDYPDGGAPMQGRMPECHSCHLPRSGDDFLFGVPAASRSAKP